MDEASRWPQAWVRAVLEVALLGVLSQGPAHGYGLAEILAAQGFGRLRGGSLYPVLARLEDAGDVTTTWQDGSGGPGRKLYTITDTGRHRRERELDELADLLAVLDQRSPTMLDHRSEEAS